MTIMTFIKIGGIDFTPSQLKRVSQLTLIPDGYLTPEALCLVFPDAQIRWVGWQESDEGFNLCWCIESINGRTTSKLFESREMPDIQDFI